MAIRLLVMGRTEDGWVKEGLEQYVSRLRHYVQFSVEELPQLKGVGSLSHEELKSREGALLLRRVKDSDTVVLLDERGTMMRSTEFSAFISKTLSHVRGDLVFIVGGAYGFSPDVYARSNSMLSLSSMTFSHQMVRVFFSEQLYRAFTIMKGEPYHNE